MVTIDVTIGNSFVGWFTPGQSFRGFVCSEGSTRRRRDPMRRTLWMTAATLIAGTAIAAAQQGPGGHQGAASSAQQGTQGSAGMQGGPAGQGAPGARQSTKP